jgi:C1A family cysteine protease
MALFEPRGFGWLPSAPDFRDYLPNGPEAQQLFERLRSVGANPADAVSSIDLREYFVDVPDQLGLNSSVAHACAALVEYFERRAHGRLLRPSRLFLHQNALRLSGSTGQAAVELRIGLKSMVRFGAPHERYWPYDPQRLGATPDAFLYSFTAPYRSVTYVRLDARGASPAATLHMVRAFLAAGFPTVFGFSVPNSLTLDGDVPYRPTFDSILGGQAVIAVGYDDRWLRGSRGALLVRSSWGAQWGHSGYGWLPYALVEEQLAQDFWTVLHSSWMDSGEFDLPQLTL